MEEGGILRASRVRPGKPSLSYSSQYTSCGPLQGFPVPWLAQGHEPT